MAEEGGGGSGNAFEKALAEKDMLISVLREKMSHCVDGGHYDEKCRAALALANRSLSVERRCRTLEVALSTERKQGSELERAIVREREARIACMDMISHAADEIRKAKAEAMKERDDWRIMASIISALWSGRRSKRMNDAERWTMHGPHADDVAVSSDKRDQTTQMPEGLDASAVSLGDPTCSSSPIEGMRRCDVGEDGMVDPSLTESDCANRTLSSVPRKEKRRRWRSEVMMEGICTTKHHRSSYNLRSSCHGDACDDLATVGIIRKRPTSERVRFSTSTEFIKPSMAALEGAYFPKVKKRKKRA
jgi:hypothetical protein